MQISGLPASGAFTSTDVLAIDVEENGVKKTYKLTGATLAAALAGIGNYLTNSDLPLAVNKGGTGAITAAGALAALGALPAANVYNSLDQTAAGYALDARQGKVLNDKRTWTYVGYAYESHPLDLPYSGDWTEVLIKSFDSEDVSIQNTTLIPRIALTQNRIPLYRGYYISSTMYAAFITALTSTQVINYGVFVNGTEVAHPRHEVYVR